jgi:hypothetical protein
MKLVILRLDLAQADVRQAGRGRNAKLVNIQTYFNKKNIFIKVNNFF